MNKETKKEWFLDRYCGMQFAALLQNGELTEFFAEKEPRPCIVGNIYKGKVVNVLSGMNAVFVNCGLSKNCYLSLEEMYADYTKYDGTMVEMNEKMPELKEGDEIIVQVVKPARGTKGAKVSMHLSFVGRRLIYLPNTQFLGISRKITDENIRGSLLKAVEKMRFNDEDGFIIRTQAPFATQKQLKAEAEYLKNLYMEMIRSAKDQPVGSLLFEDADLPVRIIRDTFGDDIGAIHVGEKSLYERLLKLIKLRRDLPKRKLVLYEGNRSLLYEQGIMQMIFDAMQPVVPLKSGGSLVIEHTEAMTVIDVNSGSYIGDNSLEETVFAVNLEAAKEIARQVRLQNIGGIIVVDFIDMLLDEHRIAVTDALKKYLLDDKAKCNVLPMSELGLVQFTRKRVGNDVQSLLVKPCAHCAGKGYVQEDIFIVSRIRAAILDCFADGYTSAIIELNEKIMQKILDEALFSEEIKTCWKDKRVYCIPHKTYEEANFTIRGDNTSVLTLSNKAQILY